MWRWKCIVSILNKKKTQLIHKNRPNERRRKSSIVLVTIKVMATVNVNVNVLNIYITHKCIAMLHCESCIRIYECIKMSMFCLFREMHWWFAEYGRIHTSYVSVSVFVYDKNIETPVFIFVSNKFLTSLNIPLFFFLPYHFLFLSLPLGEWPLPLLLPLAAVWQFFFIAGFY